jgi:3-hydroxyisobutyrate dehydrogenase
MAIAEGARMTRIAFIGLGHMGLGMAANQVRAGHEVLAFDLSADALKSAAAQGCTPAVSIAAAVAQAQLVITMLPAGQHVREVFTQDVIPNAPKTAILVDCSTIDVDSARFVGAAACTAGFRFADAPVSGGIMAADAGTLTFMVGCEEPDYPAVNAALSPMAKAIVHAGGVSAGQAAKICNNMVLGISMLAVCEGFALAEKLNLSPEKFFEIASQSSGQCWSLSTYCPWPGVGPASPADRNYEGGFLTALMLKDLKLAQAAAANSGAATPMGAQAEALYALFDRLGYGQKDFSSALQVLRGDLDGRP